MDMYISGVVKQIPWLKLPEGSIGVAFVFTDEDKATSYAKRYACGEIIRCVTNDDAVVLGDDVGN